ncbi:myo-inositol-1(or 4)-monophosphatase [Desulfotomaculum arcticum]|uniref:Myo-inositol-1(Or 4)-monophosphatase n=1 Tax=Desulfotruncus arcticus DSM 17038 TaxID=1121424 RepID=A0A1I2V1H8_9FIRM|nr:inositol monophosphatase family protein [Desulfotruncus arcticus]SFG82893.1 myo-inositol-1(or 4)-monophosphatase [Desulfotomaculum arcticum] [Desulfotruncus arcticus DSM 17038]
MINLPVISNDEKEMYDFAYNLTRSAGLKLQQEREHSVIKVREKTSHTDLVTDHDLLIEQFIAESIMRKYPGHGILAEESRARASADSDGYTWVLDPIDGTVNYYRFGRNYAISLALYRNGNPVLGLIYDVANGVMFGAGPGEGATMNGCPLDILPERKDRVKTAVVAMSLRTMMELAGWGMDVWGMLSRVQAHRYLGCASLELCKIANGEYDLFVSSNIYEWDIAAARIFLEQRGCFLHSRSKENNKSRDGKLFVVAFRSPLLWQEALAYFPKCVRDDFYRF